MERLRYRMAELETAAAVESISMEVDSDEEMSSVGHFNEHTGNIAPRPVKQDVQAEKENESMDPTENGERVPDVHTLSHPTELPCPRVIRSSL